MDSISTNSMRSFAPLESPPTSISSGFSDMNTSLLNRWKKTPDRTFMGNGNEEFEHMEPSEPFIIKFQQLNMSADEENPAAKFEVVCQIDDFAEVPLAQAMKCMELVREDRIMLETVHIEINVCEPKSKIAIENVLKKFAERRDKCSEIVMVKRLAFFIYDFTYARDMAPIISMVAPRPFEVNIGAPKKKVYPLTPSTESGYVLDFLQKYLQPRNSWQALRTLRIYNFVSLDARFQSMLNQCVRLNHLTLSNIDEIGLFENEHVNSVLLDSCDYAYTLFDFEFAKKIPRLFPNATTLGFLNCNLDVAISAVKQFSSPRLGDERTHINFFQPDKDFRKFLFEVTKSFEVLNDDKELEGEIEIQGHNGGPVITVFNKDRRYVARNRDD